MISLLLVIFIQLSSSPCRAELLKIGASELNINIQVQTKNVNKPEIIAWIKQGATAVNHLYGHFPVPRLQIEVLENSRQENGVFGREEDGELVKLYLGKNVSSDTLKKDWTLTHELLHLAFPDLDDEFLWAEEGLATYLEPMARAKSGMISESEYWKLYLEGMPKGMPQPSDQGLNKTHTWANTYWGGALFWFSVDFRIRQETKKSLLDSLRAILAKGGDAREAWTMKRVIQVGDKAIGKSILQQTYEQMAMRAGGPDLPAMWRELGVEKSGESIRFKQSNSRKNWLK